MTLILLIVILLLLFGGGGYYYAPRYGPYSWGPLGLILVILLILWIVGYLAPPP